MECFSLGKHLAFPVNIKDMKNGTVNISLKKDVLGHGYELCCIGDADVVASVVTLLAQRKLIQNWVHCLTCNSTSQANKYHKNGTWRESCKWKSNFVFSVLSSSPTGASSEPWQGLKRQAGSTLP